VNPTDIVIIAGIAITSVYYTIRRVLEHKHEIQLEKLEIRKLEIEQEAKVWDGISTEKKELESE
jgi:hypothetical protein